jgi:hypothetical protein
MSVPIAVVGQSFRVYAILDADLTGASSVDLKYKPPSPGTVGTVAAVVDNALTGAIHADIPAASLTPAGDWSVWAVAVIASGQTVKTYGSAFKVVAEGTVVVTSA